MKIEIGKAYRNANGDRVFVNRSDFNDEVGFISSSLDPKVRLYFSKNSEPVLIGEVHPHHLLSTMNEMRLISEWKDETKKEKRLPQIGEVWDMRRTNALGRERVLLTHINEVNGGPHQLEGYVLPPAEYYTCWSIDGRHYDSKFDLIQLSGDQSYDKYQIIKIILAKEKNY